MMIKATNGKKFKLKLKPSKQYKTKKLYYVDLNQQEPLRQFLESISKTEIKHIWSLYYFMNKNTHLLFLRLEDQKQKFKKIMKQFMGAEFQSEMQQLRIQAIKDDDEFIEKKDLKLRLFSRRVDEDSLNFFTEKAIFVVDEKKQKDIISKSTELIDILCMEGIKHIIYQISGNQQLQNQRKNKKVKYIWIVSYEGSLDSLKAKYSKIFHVTLFLNFSYKQPIDQLIDDIKGQFESTQIKVTYEEDKRFQDDHPFYIVKFDQLLYSIHAFKYLTILDDHIPIKSIEFIEFDQSSQEDSNFLYLVAAFNQFDKLENFQNSRKKQRIQLTLCERFNSIKNITYQKYKVYQHYQYIGLLQKLDKISYLIPGEKIKVNMQEVKELIEEKKLCVDENIREQVMSNQSYLVSESINQSIKLFEKLIIFCERVSF